MVSAFTPNLNLQQPARGDLSGTWDTAMNAGFSTIVDAAAGGTTAISLSNANVNLTAAQWQSAFLVFTGTLTAGVTVNLVAPTSAGTQGAKCWTVENQCVASSAFNVTLATTVSGGQAICCPPYEPFDVKVDASGNVKYRNFGRVGTYLDYAGSSTPIWITGCTVPPYLDCNGTTFSSATYPALTSILGSTTLPDYRGRVGGYLTEGTTRISTAAGSGGVAGGTLFATGGADATLLSSINMPNVTYGSSIDAASFGDAGHTHSYSAPGTVVVPQGGTGAAIGTQGLATGNSKTGVTFNLNPGGSSAFTNLPPIIIGGIRMIRAA